MRRLTRPATQHHAQCAERMDELEGKNRWREVPESGYYNHRILQEKINQLNNMMQNGDVFQVRPFVGRLGVGTMVDRCMDSGRPLPPPSTSTSVSPSIPNP